MKINIMLMLLAMAIGFPSVASAKKDDKKVIIEIVVADKGFEPKSIDVKPGSDVVLKITRKTDMTCSKEIQIPAKNLRVDLPLNKTVTVAVGKLEKGEIRFGCGMDMMDAGRILVH